MKEKKIIIGKKKLKVEYFIDGLLFWIKSILNRVNSVELFM